MTTIAEEIRRERLSKIALLISIFSLIPFLGVVFIIPALFVTGIFYLISKRNPEKYGGIYRLRVSFILCFVAIIFQYCIFFSFLKLKIEQAEEAKYKITVVRLYSAAEALESYESKKGFYPSGDTLFEIEKQLDEEKIFHLPFEDGWGRELILKSRMWDYSITAQSPPKNMGNSFPVIKAQKPKPVFPFVGTFKDYEKLTLK